MSAKEGLAWGICRVPYANEYVQLKLSASHPHNSLNRKHSTKELGQGDIILKSIIFEVSLSSAVLKNPGQTRLSTVLERAARWGLNPNPNFISNFNP